MPLETINTLSIKKQRDENFEFVKKNFERNFPGIKYTELSNVLKEVLTNDRITTYSSESVNNFEGLENEMKEISLSNRPSRLYLESENQYPRFPRIENASKGYVPTIKYFSKKIESLLLKKK